MIIIKFKKGNKRFVFLDQSESQKKENSLLPLATFFSFWARSDKNKTKKNFWARFPFGVYKIKKSTRTKFPQTFIGTTVGLGKCLSSN